MSLMDSFYQRIELCFVFTKVINDEIVDRFIRKDIGNKSTEDLTAISGIIKKILLPRNHNCTTCT